MTGIEGCFVLFFSTFLYANFFFQIIKRRYFTHASRTLKLEENGHVICRQHPEGVFCCSCNSMGSSVWPAQSPKTHGPTFRMFGWWKTEKHQHILCQALRWPLYLRPRVTLHFALCPLDALYLVSWFEFCVIEGGPNQSPPPSQHRKQTA